MSSANIWRNLSQAARKWQKMYKTAKKEKIFEAVFYFIKIIFEKITISFFT